MACASAVGRARFQREVQEFTRASGECHIASKFAHKLFDSAVSDPSCGWVRPRPTVASMRQIRLDKLPDTLRFEKLRPAHQCE